MCKEIFLTEYYYFSVNACRCRQNCTVARCPCIKSKISCSIKCTCKECDNNKQIMNFKDGGCRCGEKKGSIATNRCTNLNQPRASRCPCLKSQSKCSLLCLCRSCANPYGIAPDKSLLPTMPRAPSHSKREETIHKRRPMKELFEPIFEEEDLDKEWSFQEKAALISCIRLLVRVPLVVVPETVHAIYTAIIHNEAILTIGIRLRKKSIEDFQIIMSEMKFLPFLEEEDNVTENQLI